MVCYFIHFRMATMNKRKQQKISASEGVEKLELTRLLLEVPNAAAMDNSMGITFLKNDYDNNK